MAEFRTSIEIEARPETVFDHLVTDDGITAWLGQHADVDARPGGQFAVDIASHPVRGEYVHVERPSRVVVTWGFLGSPDLPAGASTVEFLLTPVAAGTRVDLRHGDLPDDGVEGHAYGWRHFLPRLVIAAPGGDPGADDDWQPLTD
ncbi:SRPBCC family protein [Propionibacteriaceae bacterium Y2011]